MMIQALDKKDERVERRIPLRPGVDGMSVIQLLTKKVFWRNVLQTPTIWAFAKLDLWHLSSSW